ncbi:MAG: hypothetical protein EPN82_15620 [Bacteroidetes bacterium]|nr:MAG: hypothetical protein EPN82_15620 [Bacteroidota bacterium]
MSENESDGSVQDDEIIVIKTYYDEVYADIDVGHLKSHNIQAFVSIDDPAIVSLQRSAKLLIRKVDKQRAMKVLAEMH